MAEAATRRIDDIRVGDRHRRHLGNIEKLAASIRERGLLHPVVVTPDGRLIAGQRRLEACKQLGWSEVTVTIISGLGDAHGLLCAERDENTCRQDMTPSEKASLGMALEELERPKAKERQRASGPASVAKREGRNDGPVNLPEPSTPAGETRHIVGNAIGMSATSYERARSIVRASRDESLPKEVRSVATKAAEEMDRTGKVTPAYNAAAETLGLRATNAAKRNGRAKKSPLPRRIGPGAEQRRVNDFEGIVINLVEMCRPLEHVTVPVSLSTDRREEFIKDLTEAARAVRCFLKNLKEAGHE